MIEFVNNRFDAICHSAVEYGKPLYIRIVSNLQNHVMMFPTVSPSHAL